MGDFEEYMIPCQFCNELILDCDYEEHVVYCENITREYVESSRLHSNYQIPRGHGTLREFVMEHFHVDTSSTRQRMSTTNSSTLNSFGTSPSSGMSIMFGSSPSTNTTWEALSEKKGCKNVYSHLLDVAESEVVDTCCCICLDQIWNQPTKSNSKKIVKLICGHVYCKQCIVKWLDTNTACPLCKRQLEQ